MRRRGIIFTVVVVCVLVLAGGLFRLLSGLLAEYWWFSALGYGAVFTRILFTKVVLWCVGFALGFGAVAVGFLLARRMAGPIPESQVRWGELSLSAETGRRVVHALFWTGAVLAGLIGGSALAPAWERVLLFLNRVPFGTADPIFGNDVGFYVFVYPVLARARAVAQVLVWVSLLSGGAYYMVAGVFNLGRIQILPRRAFAHVHKTLGVIFLLVAAGFLLDRYGLLYSTQGAVFGAGYADVHARLPACWIMFVLSLGVAGAFFVTSPPRNVRITLGALGVWALALVLVQGAYPALLRWARVRPNELELEEPYIRHNIEQTLKAFKLDGVREVLYPVAEDIQYEEVVGDRGTIDNVRLWDWRPLRATYRELQALRTYYDFSDVDVDRYDLERGYTQTLLSMREIRPDQLPPEAREKWVNRRLQYTHGYGLCMSPVNEATEDGLPAFLVRDIPPVGPADLPLTRPQIYYGEVTTDYVFANTAIAEFDHPAGNEDVRIHYDGRGGVPVGGLLSRLVFWLYFQDVNVLLTDYLSAGSRAMFRRQVSRRVHQLAPYLLLDQDPYPVVHDGGVVWIQDAYTTSRLYPYSQPSLRGRLNYIRNSVKAVVDAYHGSVTFYVADPDDAIIRAYARIFPGLYKPIEEMPAHLRRHLRYPLTLFELQAQKFSAFHMREPEVFYNQEDLWEGARELYRGQEQPVEPYYVVMRLPQGERAEFIVMQPFTPKGRANMVAWLVGRCDGENYGEMLAFRFPKGKLIPGPQQVEKWIDQDPDISQQLTLWDQGGSRVIRGNLLVLPIAGGILYFEPLYMEAQANAIPQLKRVITAYGSAEAKRVTMAPTLHESLAQLFGVAAPRPEAPPEATPAAPPGPELRPEVRQVLEAALQSYASAQEALAQGDWEAYGRHVGQMKAKLDELAGLLPAEGEGG